MNLTFKGNFGELDLKIDGKTATGVYQKSGTITGEFLQNKFIGKWQNKEMEGLIEFTILNDKLEGTWKKGLDPGPMNGKW